MCLSPMALAAEPTPTDITATGLRLGRDADHPLPTEETVYKAGEDTVTYRPATESANAKLILDNATINGIPDSSEVDGYAIELALPKNTKIDVEVKGTNTLNSCLVVRAFENDDWYSPKPVEVTIQPAEGERNATLNVTHPCSQGTVNVSGKLTIHGNIRVNVKNPPPCNGSSYAVWARSDMTIQDGATVTAEGNNTYALWVEGSLSIDNATVTATNNDSGGAISAVKQLKISNATVTAAGSDKNSAVSVWGSDDLQDALLIEGGATLTAASKNYAPLEIGNGYHATVNGGTLNLAGGGSEIWLYQSNVTVKGSGKVTLAAGTELRIASSEYQGGWLKVENGSTFVNNGKVKFVGDILEETPENGEDIAALGLSGSYLRGSLVACDPSSENYVELVITKPASYAANKVNYMAWDATNKQLKPAQCEDPNTVASSSEVVVAWGESGKTTWYVIEDNVSISGKVTVNGDVHLILADGKTLTTKHIEIESGSLTVYGQSEQSGKLSATGTISSGIYVKNGTKLTVNGGVVEATGASTGNSVGIQLGENRSANGTMTVNSGMVKATGQPASSDGYSSTGIAVNGSGSLTINGGEVTATGGSVMQNASSYGVYLDGARTAMTMSGGTLTAKATGEGEKAVVVVQGKLNLPADYY